MRDVGEPEAYARFDPLPPAEAGELLPRSFAEASHFECRFCAYAQRCWGGAQ